MTATRLVVLLAVLLTACNSDASDPTATQTAPTLDVDAAVAAAVDVHTTGCGPRVGYGTGSLIAPDVVATAAHVVAGAEDIEVISSSNQRVTGTVILFDPDLDFALIRLPESIGSPLAPRDLTAQSGEEGVVVIPRTIDDDPVTVEVADVTVLRSAKINTTDIYLDNDVVRHGFELEGSIDPGDSGAMVVVPGGGVGVVWARSNQYENRAWAIDLPPEALNSQRRAELTEAVDPGPCRR